MKFYKHIFDKVDKVYLYLLAICFVFFVSKIYFISHYPMWDEAVYLGIGKYIYSAGSSGLWEMIRPLGLPLVTGASWTLGLDQLIVSRIVEILFSIGLIIVTYLLCKELFDKKTAIISAAILAITPIFFFYSDYVMTDHVSTLAIALSIYLLIKKKYILAGVFAGVAFWFKFTHILFAGVIVLYLLYKIFIQNSEKKSEKSVYSRIIHSKYLYSLIIMLLIVGAYFFSNYILYHQHFGFLDSILRPYTDAAAYSNNPYQNMNFTSLGGFIYYIFYYIYNIIFNTIYGNILYIFCIFYFLRLKGFIGNNKDENKEKHVLLLIPFLIYLLYFSIIPYKNERFWVFFLPFLAIYAAYGIVWCYERLSGISGPKSKYKLTKSRSKSVNAVKVNNKRIKQPKKSIFNIKIVIALLTLIILMMSGYALYKDSQFYGWSEHFREPNMTIERYFDNYENGSKIGPILTTDPRFAAYSDQRYIPAYDILNKNGLFLNDWEKDTNFSAAIYNNESIPCLANDLRCIENRQKIIGMLKANFTILDSYYYNGANVTFYIRK